MINKLLDNLNMMGTGQLYNFCYRDALTGLHNRKAYEEVARHYKYVAIVDVDSLKYFNDKYGHNHGDAVLLEVAQLLGAHFDDDKVFRLHGDEFTIVTNSISPMAQTLRTLQQQCPKFSYGCATELAHADKTLQLDKQVRTQRGQRAERGERPPWLE